MVPALFIPRLLSISILPDGGIRESLPTGSFKNNGGTAEAVPPGFIMRFSQA